MKYTAFSFHLEAVKMYMENALVCQRCFGRNSELRCHVSLLEGHHLSSLPWSNLGFNGCSLYFFSQATTSGDCGTPHFGCLNVLHWLCQHVGTTVQAAKRSAHNIIKETLCRL